MIASRTQLKNALQRKMPERVHRVLALLEQTTSPPSEHEYDKALHAFSMCGAPLNAEHTLHRMTARLHSRVHTPRRWHMLLRAYAVAKEQDGAESTLHRMGEQNVFPNTVAYNMVLDCHANALDPKRADVLFHRMESGRQPCTPGRVTYGTLLKAHAKAGNVERMQQVLSLMVERGFDPGVVERSLAASTYASYGQLAKMHMQLLTMEHAKHHTLSPTSKTYSSVIRELAHAGLPSNAYDIFERAIEKLNCTDLALYIITIESLAAPASRAFTAAADVAWRAIESHSLRRKWRSLDCVDLHFFSRTSACVALIAACNMSHYNSEFGVVTGKGSKGKPPVLRNSLVSAAEALGCKVQTAKWNSGIIVLRNVHRVHAYSKEDACAIACHAASAEIT